MVRSCFDRFLSLFAKINFPSANFDKTNLPDQVSNTNERNGTASTRSNIANSITRYSRDIFNWQGFLLRNRSVWWWHANLGKWKSGNFIACECDNLIGFFVCRKLSFLLSFVAWFSLFICKNRCGNVAEQLKWYRVRMWDTFFGIGHRIPSPVEWLKIFCIMRHVLLRYHFF